MKFVSINHFNVAEFRLVYAIPETITTNSKVRKLLLTKKVQEEVSCIVVDEVRMFSAC